MGTNCRGREDCRQEELVILRCKYFQPARKKERVSRVDSRSVHSGFSRGRGCILNANLNA